jgi:hypothetical protein|tara:strand:+ start:372 stop:581 length:210 start_codon:yes stop_codon:yes gene_type:complete
MKFYRVFEIEGYKFTWAGGSILNIYYPDKETTPGRLQWFGVRTDKEVLALCLNWLEENNLIEETELYTL